MHTDGIPARYGEDHRQPITIDLRPGGGRAYVLEPRIGYVAWRVLDANTREVLKFCALKEALHWIADQTPRQLGARNFM
jgi:hypothetical protein